MRYSSIPYKQTNRFSKIVTDYLSENDGLKPFVNAFPSIDTLRSAAEQKSFDSEDRKILCNAIEEKYAELNISIPESIERLKIDGAVTITTGHQLNIFGGPLYSIYKIASVINLCRQLNEDGGVSVVPVFWLASEDHDFEEIASVSVRGNKYTWEHTSGPAVGQIDCSGLIELLESIKNEYTDLIGPSTLEEFKSFYASKNLADAHFKLITSLFKDTELIVLDADNSSLKKLFVPHMLNEINEGVQKHVESANKELEEVYKAQAHARDVNLFYLTQNSRERIVKKDDAYTTADLQCSWTKEELESELKEHPERFSPNVIMRPMYQETILPNIAYVGGGGELAYWLQLKAAFKSIEIDYPILVLRQSFALIEDKVARKIDQLGLTTEDIFADRDALKEKAREEAFGEIDLSNYLKSMNELYDAIKSEGKSIDANLEKTVESTRVDAENRIHALEKKFKRAQRQQLNVFTSRLETIDASLFPNNGLQERSASVLEYYSAIKANLPRIIEESNPLDKTFKLLKI